MDYEFSLTPPKTEKEIRHEEIEELFNPIKEILYRFREQINQGVYKLLIGDDASGRIPTLILDRVLKAIYKERGHVLPKTIFMAGSGTGFDTIYGQPLAAKREKIKDFIQHIFKSNSSSKRVMVITENIFTGKSLEPLIDTLEELDIEYDITSVGIVYGGDKIESKNIKERAFGSMRKTPSIYFNKRLSGVDKKPVNLFSTPQKKEESREEEQTSIQLLINTSREEVEKMANRLAENYRKSGLDDRTAAGFDKKDGNQRENRPDKTGRSASKITN